MPRLRVVLDGIVPSGESSRRSSANGRHLRRAHGARLDKDAVSTGPRCCRADDALPTARSAPRDASKSSLATSFEQTPERPHTTSTAIPAARGIGLVSPDAPGRSDVSSCALFRRGGRNNDQCRIVTQSSGGYAAIVPTPADRCPALRNGSECWPIASCVASPFA